MSDYLAELHASLDQRWRPEDVLRVIIDANPPIVRKLALARFRAPARSVGSLWSSMSSDFTRPVGGAAVLASAERAFQTPIAGVDPDNPAQLALAAETLGETVGWNGPRRLTREQRADAGIELSRRQYNRQFRAVARLRRKAEKLGAETGKRNLVLIGHTGLTYRITRDRFRGDPDTAHFIAYWTARKNLRRQFSLDGRANPMDEIAQALLDHVMLQPNTDWEMLAYARPTADVLAHLRDRQKGELLGQWTKVLGVAAATLERVWDPHTNRRTMTVRRGQDSSTWNETAQAYNTARASWLSILTAMGAEHLLDAACPGKVMRLMAGDLAYWHQASGHDIEPNTRVWAVLPLPWEVLDGRADCPRVAVETACRVAGLDPATSGWTAPKPPGEPVPFQVTPELVHGVTIADPAWAGLLRRAGVFSGKGLSGDKTLVADAVAGLVGGVVTSDLPNRLNTGH